MKQQRLRMIIKQPNGQLASTTGNINGIYDLSGGAREIIAAYITNGQPNLMNGVISDGIPLLMAKTTADATAYQTLSSKYATIYPYSRSSDNYDNNYTVYKNANYGYGDAILETSSMGDNSTSWFGGYSRFPAFDTAFFIRGGLYNYGTNAGIFSF